MKKKGFTLIELLAVIVILAIIALIAVPIVLNMIDSARKSGAKSSALGFIDAIEYNNGFAEAGQEGYTKIEDGNIDIGSILGLKMKGKYPDIGEVTIEGGKVVNATLCINGYNVEYKNKDAKINGTCDPSAVVKLERIRLDVEGISVTPNGTYQVEPILEPSNATYKSISYSIKDTSIATVSSTGLITGKKVGTTELTISGSNGKSLTVNVSVKNPICKRATTLHTEQCTQTDATYYCSGAGYTATGSKGTTTITYGNLGTKGTLASGDAFDCDVKGNGSYERFYYVSDYYDTNSKTFDTTKAVLIYYKNIDSSNSANKISKLPLSTNWKNSMIILPTTRYLYVGTNKRTPIVSMDYTGKAARILTVQEVARGCNISTVGVSQSLVANNPNCIYLVENTTYSSPSNSEWYWLENIEDGAKMYTISSYQNPIFNNAYETANGSIRPAIDVLKSDIDY